MKISKNFTLEEFIKSDTADRYNIDNTPSEEIKKHIIELVEKIMQPIREEGRNYGFQQENTYRRRRRKAERQHEGLLCAHARI